MLGPLHTRRAGADELLEELERDPYIVAEAALLEFVLARPRVDRSPRELYEVGLMPHYGRAGKQDFMRTERELEILAGFRACRETRP